MHNAMQHSPLIIGADSSIGRHLITHFAEQRIPFHATSRTSSAPFLPLDLSRPAETWPQLPAASVAYLCAAATGLQHCEQQPEASYHINVTQMQALTLRLWEQDIFPIFLSSNQVFDGSMPDRASTDIPCPITEYGRQKAAFEAWLSAQSLPYAVLRLTKVIAGPLPIITSWQEAAQHNLPIEAFHDLVMAPLSIATVTDALIELGMRQERGIFQLSGPEDVSYYEIAQYWAEKQGYGRDRISGISGTTGGIPEIFLPRHTTLRTSAFTQAHPTGWREVIFG